MKPRHALSAVAAVIIALGLFLAMSLLISTDPTRADTALDSYVVDRVDIQPEPPAPRRMREPSDEPRPARLPRASAPAMTYDAMPAPASTALARPRLSFAPKLFDAAGSVGALPGNLAGAAQGAGEPGGGQFDGLQTIPASSARPRYPRYAAERGLEGWVEVIFVIDPEGRVSNVRVLDSSPRGVFEDAAVKAMRRWIYQPILVRGKPVYREATQLFEFRKEDIESLWIYGEN